MRARNTRDVDYSLILGRRRRNDLQHASKHGRPRQRTLAVKATTTGDYNASRYTLTALASTLAALTALTAHGRWPYHDYEIFRWVICLSAAFAGYILRSKTGALVACIAVAIAFNPVAPLRMRAHDWQNYDIAAAITMGCVALFAWRLRSTTGPRE